MSDCPICHKNDVEIIFKKGNLDKDLTNVICKNCGLVFINPMPSQAEYHEFHKEEFLAEKNLKNLEDIKEKIKFDDVRIKKTIFDFLKNYINSESSVLDIGCGFGTFLDICKKESGAKVYGIELGRLDREVAKEYYNLDLFGGSLDEFSSLKENRKKFDVIVLHHTFEHLPEPVISLYQIKQLLKPNGILYIAVPNLMNIKKRPDILFQIAHPFTYSPYSLKLMLEKVGFGVIKFNRNAGYPGGMELVLQVNKENIKSAELEVGNSWQKAIEYIVKVDNEFKSLRSARDKLLFFLPKFLRIKIGRIFYHYLKNKKLMLATVKQFITNHKKEFLLALIAIITQGIVFFATIFWATGGFMWLSDSESYLEIAKNLFTYKGFYVNPEWGPQTFRTPLYPIFIALFYGIINQVWFVIFIQNFIGVASIILTYKLGKMMFGERAGFLAAILLIFESARLVLINQLMSEGLFLLLVLLGIYYFIKVVSGHFKWLYIIIGSSCIGLATLTRPISQLLFILIALFFISLGIVKKQIKKYSLSFLLIIVCFLAVISPWLIRNYLQFGRWELSSLAGYNLYVIAGGRFLEEKALVEGEVINAKKILDDRFLEHFNLDWEKEDQNWGLKSTTLMEPKYEDYLLSEGHRIISSDIPFYIKIHLKRMALLFIESSASRSYGALLYKLNLPNFLFYPFLYFAGRIVWIFFDFIILLALIFNFSTFKKYLWSNLFLLGVLLYFAVLSGMHSDVGRLRQVMLPFYFLFVANALILISDKLKFKKNIVSK